MTIKTISDSRDMSYQHYIDSPMPMIERKMKLMIVKNPQLINLFNHKRNHPLIRKYSHIPFLEFV